MHIKYFKYEKRPKSSVCHVDDSDREFYVMWAKFNTLMDVQSENFARYLSKVSNISMVDIRHFRRGFLAIKKSKSNFVLLKTLLDLIAVEEECPSFESNYRVFNSKEIDKLTFVDWRQKLAV